MHQSIAAICCSYSGGTNGQLRCLGRAAGELSTIAGLETPAPLFVAIGPDREHCYAVHHDAGGEIRSFAIDATVSDGGGPALVETSEYPTGGAEPCYVSVDPAGEFAFTANYAGGSLAVFPIRADGSLGERAQLIEHDGSGPNQDRQASAHPHSIVPGPAGRFVYAADLGTDELWCYELDRDAERLDPAEPATVAIHDGAGPRHLAFHSDGDRAFLANELDSTLTVLTVDTTSGELEPVQTVGTLPADRNAEAATESYPADVHVHPSGEWVYVSNRGHDSIAIFAVDGDDPGAEPVELVGHEPTGGHWPRDFALDPAGEYLFAANRRSDEIVSFRIDETDGTLEATGDVLGVQEPICLAFLE